MRSGTQRHSVRIIRKPVTGLLLLALVSTAFAAPDSTSSGTPDSAGWFQGSVRDLPGWVPPADPESASVRIGRRLNAPVVDTPYTNGLGSVGEVAQAFVRAICDGTPDTLYKLCVAYDELKDIMWLEFPQSRPITNLTADDAWMFLNARNTSGINAACRDFEGRDLRLLRVEHGDTVMVFKNFNLHRGLTLVVENERGEEERIVNLRTVAERKGVYKIYSMKD